MLRNPNIIEQFINLLLLAIIVVASILVITINYYWLGLGIFFVGLLMLIAFRYKASDYLEELLTMYPLILVAVAVGSLTQGWLRGDQRASLIPALDGLVAALPNSYPATLFISVLVGVATALLLAGILFLLLGLSFVSVIIEGGEIKGRENDKQILETVGGPGRVRIYPGQVVVFHKHGKITRAAGLGATLLRRGEKIKAIIPLGSKGGGQKIENVLTKDRIALTLNVAHGAGIELVSGTKKRLEEMQDKVARDGETIRLLKEKKCQDTPKRTEDIKACLVEVEAQAKSKQEAAEQVHLKVFQPTYVGWLTVIRKRLIEFLTSRVQIESTEAIRKRLTRLETQERSNREVIDLLKEYMEAVKQLQKVKDEIEQLQQQLSKAVRDESIESVRERLTELEAQEEPDQETIDPLKKYKDALEQLEKDKKTVAQLQKIVDGGKTVGDEHNQCYVDIAKLVAAKAPDPWGATKSGVGVNLRDVFMANEFEDLFEIKGKAEDLKAKTDQRKIAEIEKFVLDKVKGGKLSDGIVLGFVDISEVDFPESLQEKLKRVSEARLDERAALFEARARVIRARARAQAKILEGQSEGEARAAFLRELLRELRREKVLPEEALAREVLGLISRMVSAKDWESFAKATSVTISGQLGTRSEETNGSQQ